MYAWFRYAPMRRTVQVWLALMLFVFAALAPTVSHALVVSGAAGYDTEICSANSPRSVQFSSNPDSSNGQESGSSLSHCPFCLLSIDRVAPAPHPLVHLFDVLGDTPEPTIEQAFFYSEYFFVGAPPRGPPSLA